MALNLKYIVSIIGILKLASIVLGTIAYSSGMHAYINSEYNKNCFDGNLASVSPTTPSTPLRDVIELDTTTALSEEPKDLLPILWMERFFLYVTGICLFWSVVHLIIYLVKKDICEIKVNRGVDFGFHFTGAIFLIVSGIFMGYTAVKIDNFCVDPQNCQLMKEKITGACSAFLTALVFIAISIKSFGKKLYETV